MPIRRELSGGAAWLDTILYDGVMAPASERLDSEPLRQATVTLREVPDGSPDLRTSGLWTLSWS